MLRKRTDWHFETLPSLADGYRIKAVAIDALNNGRDGRAAVNNRNGQALPMPKTPMLLPSALHVPMPTPRTRQTPVLYLPNIQARHCNLSKSCTFLTHKLYTCPVRCSPLPLAEGRLLLEFLVVMMLLDFFLRLARFAS